MVTIRSRKYGDNNQVMLSVRIKDSKHDNAIALGVSVDAARWESIDQTLKQAAAAHKRGLSIFIEDTNAYTRKCVEEQHQPRYFTQKDLTKLFGVSRTTIYNWEAEGKLPKPFVPEGTDKKLWSQEEIHKWVNAGKVGRYTHK